MSARREEIARPEWHATSQKKMFAGRSDERRFPARPAAHRNLPRLALFGRPETSRRRPTFTVGVAHARPRRTSRARAVMPPLAPPAPSRPPAHHRHLPLLPLLLLLLLRAARRPGRFGVSRRSAHGPVPRCDDRGPVRPPRVRHRAPVVRPAAAAADAVPALERPLLRPRVVRVRVRRDGRRRARARVRRGAQHREPRGGRRPAPDARAGPSSARSSTRSARASSPSKLRVGPRFLPRAAYGPYWIVAVSPATPGEGGYDWAVVSGGAPTIPGGAGDVPHGGGRERRGALAVLARPGRERRRDRGDEAAAEGRGFDLSRLENVEQRECEYPPEDERETTRDASRRYTGRETKRREWVRGRAARGASDSRAYE